MLNLDSTTLQAVADKALVDAAAHPRWINAIGRALIELDQNPWIARGELHGLVIGSPSGNVYAANGTCQCPAYSHGRACWHRAAARLVRLHDEAQQHRELAAAARARQSAERPTADKIARARIATAALNELFA